MNNALTADDVTDLAAVIKGAHAGRDGRRNLRTSELDDHGARLAGLGLVTVRSGHIEMTEAGWCELFERGI
jgi:hypothetical protein